MRGNRFGMAIGEPPPRSIPAYAGEPPADVVAGESWKVYPRVCGGTGCVLADDHALPGLSPRMRGNRNLSSQADNK